MKFILLAFHDFSLTGYPGDKGDKGFVGQIGLRGSPGVKGRKGVFGDAGATGLYGIRGNKGARGDIIYVSSKAKENRSSRHCR